MIDLEKMAKELQDEKEKNMTHFTLRSTEDEMVIEKQVWASTLHRSMVLEAENAQLKELLKWCAKIMREPAVYIGTLEEKERYINNLHKKQQLLYKIDEVLK